VFFGTHMSRRKTDQILFHRCGGETLGGLQLLLRQDTVKRTPLRHELLQGDFFVGK
jgi:hypothetical protein